MWFWRVMGVRSKPLVTPLALEPHWLQSAATSSLHLHLTCSLCSTPLLPLFPWPLTRCKFSTPWTPYEISCELCQFNHARLFATLWTVACQAPLSMGFSRQEYWSGLPCSLPEDLPNPEIQPASLMSPALAGRFFTTSAMWEAHELF